ncbi:MAG TPA: ATP-binding protein [Nitrospirota bacterium]|nr:ATP-binding protein [Nitrospirota bacterium]
MAEGKLEGVIKAGIVFVCAMLIFLSVSSLKLVSGTREFLDKDLQGRLVRLSDAISAELHDKYEQAVSDPYQVYAISIKESLVSLALLDHTGTVIIDSSDAYKKGEPYGLPAFTRQRLDETLHNKTVVSGPYRLKGGTARSVFFPIINREGNIAAVGAATVDAGYIDELTRQDTTYLLLKSMTVVFIVMVVFYAVRELIKSQRRVLKKTAASGAGGSPGARDEVTFVVDTFHSVVTALKEKERELKELKEQAEDKARSIESYNENVLRSIQSGVMTFDATGRVITANEASCAILGRGHGSMPGKEASEIFGGDGWVTPLIEKTLREGRPESRAEGEVLTDSGARWLGAGTSPLISEGATAGAILVFTDITEVKELRERMELKERIAVLGEMSAGIAHELRNPMGVISGYSEFLARRLREDAQSLDAVQSIVSEIKVMDEIIREFMNFSQPTELNISEVDVKALLDESLKALSGAGEGVERRIEIKEPIPAVEGDAVLLRQTFINIIKNAFEAMPGGGRLHVGARVVKAGSGSGDDGPPLPGGRYVRVDVADTGEGIEEKDIKKIFMPFFTTKSKGTGLGLALVQKILVYHGGRATVRSVKGRGTTFSVYLPASPAERSA